MTDPRNNLVQCPICGQMIIVNSYNHEFIVKNGKISCSGVKE
jgi:hypothetical protein